MKAPKGQKGAKKDMKGQIQTLNLSGFGVGEGPKANPKLNSTSTMLKTAHKSHQMHKKGQRDLKGANSKFEHEWVGGG